jgi:hypothetical protein
LPSLSKNYFQRSNAPEASALVSLTLLAEESAIQSHEQGASTTDLIDSITMLKRLSGKNQHGLCSSLPFLEARLAAASSTPAA